MGRPSRTSVFTALLGVLGLSVAAGPAGATGGFDQWLGELEREAVERGISEETLAAAPSPTAGGRAELAESAEEDSPPAAAKATQPTATPSPPATPTAVAKAELTFEPSPPPSPLATPTAAPVLPTPTAVPIQQASPARSLTLTVIVVIVGLGGLTVAGLVLWRLSKKQQR